MFIPGRHAHTMDRSPMHSTFMTTSLLSRRFKRQNSSREMAMSTIGGHLGCPDEV